MVASQAVRVSGRRLTISAPRSPIEDTLVEDVHEQEAAARSEEVTQDVVPSAGGRRRALTVSDRLERHFEASEAFNSPSASIARRGRQRAATTSVSQDTDPRLPSNEKNQKAILSETNGVENKQSGSLDALSEGKVDVLDIVDPQVATASYFTNVSNAIALPTWLNRSKPVVDLSPMPTPDTPADLYPKPGAFAQGMQPSDASNTAYLPLEDEFETHLEKLDKKSKREIIRRGWKGFLAFAKTPIGVFFVIYGILVVFWGAALVLILIHAIPMPSDHRRKLWIEYCSQILNGLFTITGVGLIPFRLRDTYHIGMMLRYRDLTKDRRKAKGLPKLKDSNEMPTRQMLHNTDAANNAEKPSMSDEELVLSPEEEERLLHSQTTFSKSQTWYRAHETATHRAFPIGVAVIIACLNDGNSLFQCLLCGVMWGVRWEVRPAWTTGTLIPLSFLCGIVAAVLIAVYGKRTKKVSDVEKAIRDAAKEREHRHRTFLHVRERLSHSRHNTAEVQALINGASKVHS